MSQPSPTQQVPAPPAQERRRFETAWATLRASTDTLQVQPRETLRMPRCPAACALLAESTLPPFFEREGRPAEITVVGKLGEGGMGVVFLARQAALARDVAVKSLRPSMANPEAAAALLQEAWITGSLEHPNVVPIHALGRDEEGLPQLVMKRIEGVSWHAVLEGQAEHPRWSVHGDELRKYRTNIELLLQVCSAVQYAHSRGILHCDLKPDNVMLGPYGEVYVLDWGIAVSLQDDGSGHFPLARDVDRAIGTPAYMSPEQAAGEGARFCFATDVYALGAILHRVITGQPRHAGDDLRAVLHQAWLSEPCEYPATVCPELARILNRAMARDPADRYPDVGALREALATYLEHLSSIELGLQADARLEELEEQLRAGLSLSGTQAGGPDHRGLHDRFGGCRFGYQQALRIWPENPGARAGLQRALRRMAEHELEQGAYEAAAELVRQLEPRQPELERRLQELKQRLQQQDAELQRLRELQHQTDLSVGGRLRSWIAFGLALLVVAVPWPLALLEQLGLYQRFDRPSLIPGLLFVVPFGLLVALALFLGRRVLLKTRVNRALFGTLLLIIVARAGHRLLAVAFELTVRQMLVLDLSVMFMATATLALTVDRRIGLAAALYLVAFYIGLLAPAWSPLALSTANFLALLIIGLVWLRQGQEEPASGG